MSKIYFLLFFILFKTTFLLATELTLETFVFETLKNHPTTKISLSEYKAVLAKNIELKSGQDWNIFVNYSRTVGSSLLGTYTSTTKNTVFDANTSKTFSQYGTQFEMGLKYQSTTDQPSLGGMTLPNSRSYGLNFKVSQPLLRNAFGALDKYPLKLKELSDKLATIAFNQQLQGFIEVLVNEYIVWIYLNKDVDILKNQVSKAKKQLEITRKQYNLNASDKLDLITSQQNVLMRENSLKSKMYALKQQQKKISFYMAGNIEKGNKKLESSDKELFKYHIKDSDKTLKYISNSSTFKRLFDLSEAISALTLKFQQDQSKATFDVFVSTDLSDYKNYLSNQANSEDNFTDTGKATPYTVGFMYSKPLMNTKRVSAALNAEQELQKTIQTNKIEINNIKETILTIYDQFDFVNEQIKRLEQSIDLSKTAAELEFKRFKQGRSDSLKFYHDYQNQELAYQLQLNQNEQLLHQLTTQLLSFEDKLIKQFNLEQLEMLIKENLN